VPSKKELYSDCNGLRALSVEVGTLLAEQMKTYLDYAERERSIEDAAADVWRKDLEKWQMPSYNPVEWSW
jgi:hypothetical protein